MEHNVIPDSLNPVVAEKAKEAVALATTVLGMSQTDVVEAYNHIARQHGVEVGTEMNSSKVWLKFYRGVQSAIGFDSGVERVEGLEKGETVEVPRKRLADDATLEIVKRHSDPKSLEKISSMQKESKRLEQISNNGRSGNAGFEWESILGEMVASIAIKGASATEAIEATRATTKDMKEVKKMIPESYLSASDGSPIDIINNVTRPITDGSVEATTPRNLNSLRMEEFLEDLGIEMEEDGGTALAKGAHVEEGYGNVEREESREEAEKTLKKQAIVEATHAVVGDRFSARDYAGFRYIFDDVSTYLDHKLMPARRGDGVATHEKKSKGVFAEEERKAPSFYQEMAKALMFDGKAADASARKTLQRLEDKLKAVITEVEQMLEKGVTPAVTDKARDRMAMSQAEVSRQIQR